MKKKAYKVRLEDEEHKALKMISVKKNIPVQELMEQIILEFIAFQSNNPMPIKRKATFNNPVHLNIPLPMDVSDKLVQHRKEEGVKATVILNSAVMHWFKKHNLDPIKMVKAID